MLPKRIRSVERTLSLATAYISMSFIVLAVFQVLFAFFSYIFTTSAVFGYALLSYDFLNVGSPIIMICMSKRLRRHTFGTEDGSQVTRVFSKTITQVLNDGEKEKERRLKDSLSKVNIQ
ncbi:hypothetical protein B9Z55_010110 [Caenorhabditis nigoni]|nr:hypothetical protein B9Z55_010110 [Caenorhabditis nigoni]